MATILAVGIATLDIINSVAIYPKEDEEVRALGQRLCRGGNATNTLTVLSQLGHNCHWAGVIAEEPDAKHIEHALERHNIDISAVTRQPEGKVPTSYITHNVSNGSRTIVHYRDLPEYSFGAFKQIELSQFDWLHFEGRNIPETVQMLEWAKKHQPSTPCSIEIEKEREGIEQLFPLADLLLFSKPFAEGRGFNNALDLLHAIRPSAPNAILTCTWSDKGAWALAADNEEFHSPAYPPKELVDTLGAGDTFNAGLINSLVQREPLHQAIKEACKLAGRKCGHEGLEFILEQNA